MSGQRPYQSLVAEGTKKCPECGSKEIEKHDDEIYCKKCGLVLD